MISSFNSMINFPGVERFLFASGSHLLISTPNEIINTGYGYAKSGRFGTKPNSMYIEMAPNKGL